MAERLPHVELKFRVPRPYPLHCAQAYPRNPKAQTRNSNPHYQTPPPTLDVSSGAEGFSEGHKGSGSLGDTFGGPWGASKGDTENFLKASGVHIT